MLVLKLSGIQILLIILNQHLMFFLCLTDDTVTSGKEKFCKENFQTWFVVTGGGFLSYCNLQLIKFEEEKRWDFKKQLCNYEKKTYKTHLKIFLAKFFLARYPALCPDSQINLCVRKERLELMIYIAIQISDF